MYGVFVCQNSRIPVSQMHHNSCRSTPLPVSPDPHTSSSPLTQSDRLSAISERGMGAVMGRVGGAPGNAGVRVSHRVAGDYAHYGYCVGHRY